MNEGISKNRWASALFWFFVTSAFLSPALYALNYYLTPKVVGYWPLAVACRPAIEKQFDTAAWSEAEPGDKIRFPMANNLLKAGALNGSSTDEVKTMLGRPLYEQRFEGGLRWRYLLDSQRDFPAGSWLYPKLFKNSGDWSLVVIFMNDRVVDVELRAN